MRGRMVERIPLPLGEGIERRVYPDMHHPDRVRKIALPWIEGEESIPFIKGRYYLTKILHILFPDHIPDVYASWKGKENVIIAQRIELDAIHRRYDELLRDTNRTSRDESILDQRANERRVWFKNEKETQAWVTELKKLGINFDDNPQNFAHNIANRNKTVYVDSFEPWIRGDLSLRKNYHFRSLRRVIDELPSPKKEQARNYLYRLEQLFLEEGRRD